MQVGFDMEILGNCAMLGITAVLAWFDIKKQEFPLWLLCVGGAVSVCVTLLVGEFSIHKILGGALVGGMLILCCACTKESVGFGDGLMFVVTGIYLGLWKNLLLLLGATAICAVFGAVLLITKRAKRNDRLPFAPFVLASEVLMLLLGG